MSDWNTQVIYAYAHPDGSVRRVLWATEERNIDVVTVQCIETGRMPIIDIRPYGPLGGPAFDVVEDELDSSAAGAIAMGRGAGVDSVARHSQRTAPIRPVTVPVTRAKEILGQFAPLPPFGAANPATIGLSWRIQSTSAPSVSYTVTIRPDTRSGGAYAHCTCPSWSFQRGKGKECKHIIELRQKGSIQ